jgi:hypothetical protein
MPDRTLSHPSQDPSTVCMQVNLGLFALARVSAGVGEHDDCGLTSPAQDSAHVQNSCKR